jgi:hypothetical protein
MIVSPNDGDKLYAIRRTSQDSAKKFQMNRKRFVTSRGNQVQIGDKMPSVHLFWKSAPARPFNGHYQAGSGALAIDNGVGVGEEPTYNE